MILGRTLAGAARRGNSLCTVALAFVVTFGPLATGALPKPRPDAPGTTASTASHPGPPRAVQPKKGATVPALPSAPLKGLPTARAGCATPPRGAAGHHDSLKPGECLTQGKHLAARAALGKGYELWVQGDGNVVLYRHRLGTYSPVLQTGTRGRNVSLRMQRDGNVVVRDGRGTPLWSLGTGGCGDWGARLRVRADANLVLYDRDGGPLWARHDGPSSRPC
ncbi:hypothetical protein [Streptomyces sp. NPDC059063]|uniref:hypothetical protein n=1 Tax=unclassified Streptomyces TaxID=2593676 RepID=UPI003678A7A7